MSRLDEKNFNSHITKSQGTQERSIHCILSNLCIEAFARFSASDLPF